MKKSLGGNKNRECPVQALFLAGFCVGMILPDILWKIEWHQKTIAAMYLLSAFSTTGGDEMEYFWQVLKMRGGEYLLGAACGFSVFGVPFAVAGSFYLGLKTGLLLTISILQFGFQGGLIGVGLLFPQYLVYIPCCFFLYRQSYRQSVKIWKNRSMIPGGSVEYFIRIVLCGGVYLAGMALEVYCNPKILEWLIQKLNIF